MTLEELKTEANKLGYKLVPIKKYVSRSTCVCGQKYKVELWLDTSGTGMFFYKCPKCGLKGYPASSREGAKLNWNRKVEELQN